MRHFSPSLLMLTTTFLCTTAYLKADVNNPVSGTEDPSGLKAQAAPFEPFTGKILKPKVRLRLQPTYDGQILREMAPGDMVIVLGETEDFYAIEPPAEFKAYVYRTYVLDNVIEGNRVNVRLKPDVDAPVLSQLDSGTIVNGTIDPANNKWLAIKMPENVRFYIAKEYVNKIGDAGMMARLETKREDVLRLLSTTEVVSKAEMAKPFDQININGIRDNYQHIVLDYPEFPAISAKAKELLVALQEEYANKKLAYVDIQSSKLSSNVQANKKLAEELNAHKSKIAYLEQQIANQKQEFPIIISNGSEMNKPIQLPLNMSVWLPVEEKYFQAWSQNKGNVSVRDFYNDQSKEAFVLKGVVDTYNRPIKNKPGDYMLVNANSKLPIAFLYSTQINLQEYIGHEVSVVVAPRPNNNFAFPAYYVLSFE